MYVKDNDERSQQISSIFDIKYLDQNDHHFTSLRANTSSAQKSKSKLNPARNKIKNESKIS